MKNNRRFIAFTCLHFPIAIDLQVMYECTFKGNIHYRRRWIAKELFKRKKKLSVIEIMIWYFSYKRNLWKALLINNNTYLPHNEPKIVKGIGYLNLTIWYSDRPNRTLFNSEVCVEYFLKNSPFGKFIPSVYFLKILEEIFLNNQNICYLYRLLLLVK